MAIQRSAIWRNSWGCTCLATVAFIASPTPAEARGEVRLNIDIQSSTLPEAITELAREANVSIGAEGNLPRVRTRPVRGRMTIAAALEHLLGGSGYVADKVSPTAWRIARSPRRVTMTEAPLPAVAVTSPRTEADIIVTATKRALTLREAPVAAEVVMLSAARQLDPASNTARVAEQVEGLALTGQGAGRNRMFLRGIADSPFGETTQTTVAVLLNDVRLTYYAPDPDIRLVDVDRVELLKGPQGSLYGSGVLGGIYRIVTNRADPSEFSLGGAANVQSVTGGEFGGGGSLVANLPLVADVAALRLVAYGEKSSGWLDTGDRRNGNGSSVGGVRADLGVDAGGAWRADLTGFGQWLDARDSNYTYRPEAHVRPAQLAEPHDNDLLHASLRLAREGATQIVVSTGYTRHQVHDRYDATQGAGSFGLADPRTLDDDARYGLWDSEGRMTGAWGRLGWLGGVSYVNARQDSRRVLNGAGGRALTVETVERRAEDLAMFGEATLPLSSAIDATLGARVYHSALNEERADTGELGSEGRVRTGITPSAALAWRPRAGRLLYARYGSAIRPGGLTALADGTVDKLDSDELATLEAGWREQAGRWSLDLSVYRSWWHDIQSDVLQPSGLIEAANVGRGAIAGGELSIRARFGERWRVEAGGMMQSALLVRNQSGLELDDRRLPVVPSWTLRGSVAHDVSFGAWFVTISADARYVGPARLSFDPALDRPMGNFLEPNLGIAATRGRWTVSLEARNLFDARGDSFAYGNPLRILSTNQYVRQDPFTARLAITVVP